jgi:predicted ATP-grasp superfamily ATP-dependent carboligase
MSNRLTAVPVAEPAAMPIGQPVAPTGAPGVVLLGSDFKALGVVRSLGRRGIPSVVIDNHPRSAWFSRYVRQRFVWNGSMEDPAFVDFLVGLAAEHHLDRWVLIPAQDEVVGMVARHAERLGACYQLVTPSWEVVRWAFDKRLTHQMARETGVAYPRTWYPASEAELDGLDITLPVIIKPAISVHLQYATRLKALPAATRDELRAQYRAAAAILSADEIMVQETIPGGGDSQFSVAAYCVEGEPLLSMTARRTRQYPIDFGLGSSYVEAIELPELLEPAAKILRFMGLTGMVEVEFKRDPRDGLDKLLDINVRPWGWHTLCIACGLDFPYIQYRGLLGDVPDPVAPRYGARWLRLMTDLPAGLQLVRGGLTSPRAYLRSLWGRTVFSVADWRDPLPAAGDLAMAAARVIGPRLRRLTRRTRHAASQGTPGQAGAGAPEAQG